ncbi:head GIN domain-containing protein [Salegentibacter sp. F188]|uniref:Head GIN domain-containing protein n=1 Tax=Autumnicola patrickiae TaxID=3075591 RepID=A0ABU3E393_9FLAO|nr:head GIN domain-containing protein [Salegentibacter sp. F188]MDT0690458.1 head GIN domain-containing protein [Salegentibacter sp. F188]
MKQITFLLLLFSGMLSAQDIVQELENFSEVKVYNGLEVELIRGDNNRAIIGGQSKEEVTITAEDGVLKVKMKLDNIWKRDNTRIKIYYNELQKLNAFQSSSIRLKDKIEQQEFELQVQEGSLIFANVDVKDLNSKAFTGGEIEVEGETVNQVVTIRAGGKFHAGNLKSENVEIEVSAGGVGDINASNKVTAKVRAGGTVNVYGDPEVIDKQTFLGGKIIRRN